MKAKVNHEEKNVYYLTISKKNCVNLKSLTFFGFSLNYSDSS